MTIKKFQGATEEEATSQAKMELGEDAVVMNVKEVKPKGLLKAFKQSVFEVTAAVEEKENRIDSGMAFKNAQKQHETINMAADEPIQIPPISSETIDQSKAEKNALEFIKQNANLLKKDEVVERERIEEKLENLQSILEKQMAAEKRKEKEEDNFIKENPKKNENLSFIKMLYETLIDNEVDEKYVNQIIDEVEKINLNGNSMDHILSNIYQKMILKFGQPHGIELSGPKPRVVFL